MSYVIGPLAGYNRRVGENLDLVLPDLPKSERRRLCRVVPANVGRMLMELKSGDAFVDRIRGQQITGDGLKHLDQALQDGRPIIVVSGHFGNFDAMRAALSLRGHKIGALYRKVDDPALDQEFFSALSAIAAPIFPRGRKGLASMLRFLKQGNTVALLTDQYVGNGTKLSFFGMPAKTSLSPAEMALKYNALLVPVYGIRRKDGFELIAEPPISHTDPITMSQQINDSLEARVRVDMDQWLWIHRRWKQSHQRKRSAAKMRR